jgi:predicted RecA/RadA family phage recombinase
MKNGIACGDTQNYVNSTGSAIAAGAVVILGNTIGIAINDIADGATGAVATEGVFELAAVNDAAFSQNDLLFWDTNSGKLTKTASSTTKLAGRAHKAKALSTALGQVEIHENTLPVAATVAALTDNSGGTGNGTLEVIGGSYSQTAIANNFADLAAKQNAIITALKTVGLMAS